ncbi:amino acid adenylation domain-containing protein [Bradyrhizobium ontarionense]|uniref:Amino acid adenylation domain-containing protein n=2 Tax=Bradyrhizobium ontarionense TaxID=2898149 RepID=A0ABY3R7K0_9BRAD|nr:amino acid adenylation domain-containing protein [Bradyrhizobium sp. A19]
MLLGVDARRDQSAHIVCFACRLAGELRLAEFERAWRRVLRRHSILRTGFSGDGKAEIFQFARADVDLPFEVLTDGRSLDAYIAIDGRRRFDLDRPPLIRVAVLLQAPGAAELVLTHHHAVMDGWALRHILDEVMACYGAECAGTEPELPTAVPFSRFIRWWRRRDAGSDSSFWQQRLAGFNDPVPIGAAKRPTGPADGYGVKDWRGTPDLADAVRHCAQRLRITPALLMQAAWALTLAHLSGRSDIVIGVTSSGRSAGFDGADQVVGPLMVTLPQRFIVDVRADVGAWLSNAARGALDAAQYEHADSVAIREAAAVPVSRTLFESVVVVQNLPVESVRLTVAGLTLDLSDVRVEGGQGTYPLVLSVFAGEALAFRLVYSRARFDDSDLPEIVHAFETALVRLCRAASSTLGEVLQGMPSAAQGRWIAPAAPVFVAPIGPLELQIAEAWRDIFRRPVGRDDGFLDSGGNSILALELAASLSRRLGFEIPLKWIFEDGSVARLAARLEDPTELTEAVSPLVPDASNRERPFPLTEVQRAYWVGRARGFELGGINSFTLLEVAIGRVEPYELETAWNRLVERHPMLRAELTSDGQQRIRPTVPWMPLGHRDFSHLSGTALEQAQQELRNEMRGQVADPTRWPLFSLCISEFADGERRLNVAYDPIVCDAGSIRLIANELAMLIAEPTVDLPPLAVDFRDYVLGIGRLRDGPAGARASDYWNRRIDQLPAAPELPVVPGRSDAAPCFKRRNATLHADAWLRLQARCQEARITPSALLMAIYASVVADWSRTRHFALNITLFNRAPLHPDVARMVGDFTSLTLLEVDLRQVQSLAELAGRMHTQLLNDLEHRIVDGVEVMRRLSSRTAAGQLVMPVVFTSTLGQQSLDPGGTTPIGHLVQGYGQTPQVYLDCQVGEWGGDLHCWWDCLDERLQPGVAEDMFAAFNGLLQRLSEDVAAMGRILPALIPPASLATRARVNETRSPIAEDTLDQLFLRSVECAPDAPALISRHSVMTYRELERASLALALRVAETAGAAEPVAIFAKHAHPLAIASMAVLRAGKAFTRIDPAWPLERQRIVLAIAGCRTALVDSEADIDLPADIARMPIRSETIADPAPISSRAPDSTAYVMFTSGSTGTPKGVTITHRAAVNTIFDINRRLTLTRDDRVLAVSAATFDLSIYDLFGPLAVGGTMVCIEPDEWRNPLAWMTAIARHGVTVWNSTPALMEMLVDQAESAGQPRSLGSLRAVLLSGDWIPLALPQRVRRLAPEASCIGLGGATEAAIWSTWHPLDKAEAEWSSYPYGAPLANQTTHVLNEWLQPCPDWVAGTLYIGGVGVATGYWARPDLTEAAFIVHPETGERLFKTGDLARFRPDGKLEFLGREDGQVKVRGHRIELGEIETALANHPDILAAVALADRRGISAYCVGKPDRQSPDSDRIQRYLTSALPYYMVPRDIHVIETLPLTANGKVDRSALAALAVRPEPKTGEARRIGELTEIVATAAAGLIGIDTLQADDDFFAAGGDSISGTQLIGRLGVLTGRTIALPRLFELRTPGAIAEALLNEGAAAASAIPRLPATTSAPASMAQRRFWLLDRFQPGDPRYVIAGSLELRGAVDIVALAAAVSDLVTRHEPLRTTLDEVAGELVQIIHEPPERPLHIFQVAASGEALAALFREFASLPFDLSREAPARFRLLQIAPERSIFQFSIHHIACDAWSLGVISADISRAYAFHRGKAPPPAALSLRYADFAGWERQQMRGERIAEARRWWGARLTGLGSQKLSILAGPTREQHRVFPVELDEPTCRRLEGCATRAGATLYTVLLAVFAAALRVHGGRDDIVIASSVSGRTHSELENLVGCFINLILIRIDLSSAPSLDEVVKRSQGFIAGALMRQDLPFEEIAAAARAAGAGDESPYVAVFVLQNTPPGRISLDELEVSMPDHSLGLSRYALHLHLHRADGKLRGALRTNAEIVGRGLGAELAELFARLCEAASAEPATALQSLLERIGGGQTRRRVHQTRLNRMLRTQGSSLQEVADNE